jgi:hypothetical protein
LNNIHGDIEEEASEINTQNINACLTCEKEERSGEITFYFHRRGFSFFFVLVISVVGEFDFEFMFSHNDIDARVRVKKNQNLFDDNGIVIMLSEVHFQYEDLKAFSKKSKS